MSTSDGSSCTGDEGESIEQVILRGGPHDGQVVEVSERTVMYGFADQKDKRDSDLSTKVHFYKFLDNGEFEDGKRVFDFSGTSRMIE